ncbi:MAG: helix-turn-helix transcriptional regulator [Magnetococcales bacterium]|nr:helix-turn-helix transcriptional regulator [Magnetococcales bacterium]
MYGDKGVLTVTDRSIQRVNDKKVRIFLPIVQSILPYIHEKFISLSEVCTVGGPSCLTVRERECLSWTSEGKTAWEIAQILHLSERTIVFHLSNATKKLNATNKVHAVAKAILFKHI